MENFLRLAEIQTVLFVYIMVGYICRKAKIISKATIQGFVDFIVAVPLPCMVFNSFNQDFSMKKLLMIITALSAALIICLISLLIGRVLYKNRPDNRRSIMQYGTLISNAGFAGLPLVGSAYGAEGLFIASVFIIPNRIFMWSAGISMFAEGTSTRSKLKNVLLNPGIIAVELGMVFMIFRIQLPTILEKAVGSIGGSATPLSMIIVGAILADVDIKKVLDRDVALLAAVRLAILPILTLAVMRIMRLDPLVTAVSVILTAMPVGSTTAILAERYGADSAFASKCVFVSTVLSLLTVPLLAFLL